MSDSDDIFGDMFGDMFGSAREGMREETKLQLEVVGLRRQLKEEQDRNKRLKRKARRLLDLAWNKALDQAVDVIHEEAGHGFGEELADAMVEKILLLKRTVREA